MKSTARALHAPQIVKGQLIVRSMPNVGHIGRAKADERGAGLLARRSTKAVLLRAG